MIKEKVKQKKPELIYEKLFNISLVPAVISTIVLIIFLFRVLFIRSDYDVNSKFEDITNDEFYLSIAIVVFLIFFKLSYWLYWKWNYLTYKETL